MLMSPTTTCCAGPENGVSRSPNVAASPQLHSNVVRERAGEVTLGVVAVKPVPAGAAVPRLFLAAQHASRRPRCDSRSRSPGSRRAPRNVPVGASPSPRQFGHRECRSRPGHRRNPRRPSSRSLSSRSQAAELRRRADADVCARERDLLVARTSRRCCRRPPLRQAKSPFSRIMQPSCRAGARATGRRSQDTRRRGLPVLRTAATAAAPPAPPSVPISASPPPSRMGCPSPCRRRHRARWLLDMPPHRPCRRRRCRDRPAPQIAGGRSSLQPTTERQNQPRNQAAANERPSLMKAGLARGPRLTAFCYP